MVERKIFISEEGKPEFENAVCVFMDILGFVQWQKDSFERKDALETFQKFYFLIRQELATLNESKDFEGHELWRIKIFTDNIVLGYPVHPAHADHAEPEIGFIVQDIAQYQLAMARAGHFIRGGLSIGNLFMDEYLAYGPALLEAYELEHEIARDPRIVVSKQVCELLKKHLGFYVNPDSSPQNRDFLVDSDGQIFINYLTKCIVSTDRGYMADLETLEMHKNHIEKGLSDFEFRPPVWAKYSWLATYHDFTIKEWNKLGVLDLKLCINNILHRPSPVKLSSFL